MTIKANGTDAKDVAIHFVKVTVGRATPAIIGKTVIQAKTLLESGYTKNEIIDVIDFLIDKKGIKMYSLGYVSTSINSVLKELQEEKDKIKLQELKQEVKEQAEKLHKSEVVDDGESTQRNRDKLNRFGNESRVGKKFNFDMFER